MSLHAYFRDDDRPLDRSFAQWVRQRSDSQLLARAALAASRAEALGHACANLGDDAQFSAQELTALRAHAWVGDGSGTTPFVLDAAGRWYTWRNWRHETLLAAEVLRRAAPRAQRGADLDIVADVNELFADDDVHATRWQRAAVAAAPEAGLFVLTGGPGTGKTSTALRLLLVLLRRAQGIGLPAQPTVALVAPTGKAARRLAQSVAVGQQQLRARLHEASVWRPLLERIPHQAATLHRLLGYRARDNTFARSARDPLAADIVLVDEASMADLALMRTLFTALRPEAHLILLGDPGQLAAVEAGSVLSDIVASAPQNAFASELAARVGATIGEVPALSSVPLAGRVVSLTHGWRAGGGLQRVLDALRAGDAAWLAELSVAGDARQDVNLYTCADAAALRARLATWLTEHADAYRPAATADARAALARLREAQILCALREGTFGAAGVNAAVERELGARGLIDDTQPWYHGRPVLIVRNDYSRELYNGDLGIALDGADGLRVWFESADRDGTPALRSFSPRALPEHETAWAITIHRSQGSEYGDVAVVLPPDPAQKILSRELLYTAVSRAMRRAQIWGTAESVQAAATRSLQRMGGLRDRLR